MILVPTRICNTNKCSYCWVFKNDFEDLFFSEKNIENIENKIEIIAEKTNDYNIRFFWWEPFLKFWIIKKIIEKLDKKKYNFIINTNLSLIKDEYLKFLKENDIKLIISCNWDLYSHSTTRNLESDKILLLYENIKKVIDFWIYYQINIVTTPKIVDRLYKNFYFIYNNLWGKIFNLLPVNYNWWDLKWLKEFENQLDKLKSDINNKKLYIKFINKDVNNNVWLFNSEIVIDSNWKVYPSMVILESFFNEEKTKIQISDFYKEIKDIKDDFLFYENENQKIYEKYINKILNKRFEDIIENDKESSRIFSNFLNQI